MATNNAKSFSNTLSKLVRDVNELRKDSHGLKAYDELCNEQSTLKKELLEKDQKIKLKDQELDDLNKAKDEKINSLHADIDQLERDDEVLTRKYQTQFKIWEADKKKYSMETERSSQSQRELQHWKQKAERAEGVIGRLRHEANERSREIEDHQKNIDQLQRDLQMNKLISENASAEQGFCQKELAKANEEIGIFTNDRRQMSDFLI